MSINKGEREIVWLIGGFDPSGGAGLLADARMANAMDCHPVCIQTCNTVQNHLNCLSIHASDIETLKAQMQLLLDMAKPHAIKIGLIPNLDILNFLANFCASLDIPVVIDPVFKTSSGYETAKQEMIDAYRSKLIPTAHILTPNLNEALELLGQDNSEDEIEDIATRLIKLGADLVVLKGGHDFSQSHLVRDYISGRDTYFETEADRLAGDFRGTGCALATAIACGLAKNLESHEAIVVAKSHLIGAMQNAYAQGDHHILNPQKTAKALPRLVSSKFSQLSLEEIPFSPSTGSDPLGLYPILPSYEWIERLQDTGVTTVQLRIKDLPKEVVCEQITKSVALCAKYGIRLFVNDYWQDAIAAGAYGVHLGQEDLDTADIQEIKKAGLRFGVSTHSVYELARALSLKPSYVALGPIFETTCKSMSFGPQGFDRITEWMEHSDCPVVAIGGLTLEHAPKLRHIGVNGVAVLSNITTSQQPERQVKTWMKELALQKQVL